MRARRLRPTWSLLWLLAICTGVPVRAEPLRRADVPAPLQPWIDWVLRDHDTALCASFHGDADDRRCAWPSRLTLTLDERGGVFAQRWDLQSEVGVDLPGDATRWPQDVTVDGAPALVVEQGGVPRLRLTAGRHAVSGRFFWDRLPEMLPVPAATGVLDLTLRGQPVAFPNRDAEGRLWLQRRDEASGEDSRIDVTVHRLVGDDIPLTLVTRLQLDVSGKGREVVLGPALPDGFVPMSIESPLPARLEADRRLRLQVRAGRWQLEIRARHAGPAAELIAPKADEPWDASEVWVFEAHPDLRLVTVEGVDGIDPQQTDLPPDWRQFPAYLLRPGDVMRLVERRRGNADPPPDQLDLRRTLWLDFDGGGYTFHDQITGALTRSWRLDMAPPTVLGRVAVNGQDQFITRLSDAAPTGVEIRAGALQLDADSRLNESAHDLPAVSWDHDFQSLGGQLQLPPGWRLLHASGVDDARPTWVGTWTLLDLFAVLITALATARLFGWRWGGLALLAVGLTYTEPDAPQWIWLAALAAEALVRVVPAGRFLRLVQLVRIGALAVLAIIVVSFIVGRVRQGLYPALEHPYQVMEAGPGQEAVTAPAAAPLARDQVQYYDGLTPTPGEEEKRGYVSGRSRLFSSDIDPRAVVQTGPGLPGWQWEAVSLTWNGPVERSQRLRLMLMPPWANLVLAIAQTLLLATLVVRLVRDRRPLPAPPAAAAAAALSIVLLASALRTPARADEFPPAALLDELRTRLLAPADCQPTCASLPRMRLEIDAEQLRARIEADIVAPTAVPLPGQAQQWLARTVIVDGKDDPILAQRSDGTLWIYLPAGRHQLVLEGPLPPRDTVQIPLPLPPHRVEAQVDGWTLDGLHESGVVDASLQLNRLAPADGERVAPLQTGQLPSFARVERTLILTLQWQVETRVVRLAPPDAALVMEVPLLPGEAVTTAELRVVDGKVQINMPPQVSEVRWQSTLAETSPLRLQAPPDVAWVEQWQLDASPIWHVETSGIPPVHRADAAGPPSEWRPWPGESVTFDVSRPAGVAGQTLTVDSSEMWVSPGIRSTDVTLTLSLRSSRGAQHALTLPEGAELQSVKIGGAEQPIRQEDRRVVLPISPGAQAVELRWRQSDGVRAWLQTPAVDLGTASVNAHLRVAMPANRWILFAGGPRLGPAVLFWSVIPVLLLIALGLGRVRWTPLGARQWFLLGIGLTQVDVSLAVIVVGWLLVLGWRRQRGAELEPRAFDLLQIVLVGWTVVALCVLFAAIQRGLLGLPDMQIAGNGSSAALLRWYQDRATALLPQAWIASVPLLVYRLLMLAWALWIAQALLGWLRWGWDAFGAGGYWRTLRRPPPVLVTPPPRPPARNP